MEMSITAAFPTLIGQFRIPPERSTEVNQELKRLVLEHEASEPNQVLSNVGGWHSRPNLLEWESPAVATLRSWIIESVNQMVNATFESTKAMGFHRPFRGRLQLSAWANVCRKSNYHRIHNHPGSAWSGVYYVDPGGSAPEHPLSGVLELLDPRGFTEMVIAPGLPYGQKIVIRAEAGLMVLFPGFLYHFVNPFQGEQERISIAFDVGVVDG